ncbi:YitT family protein [Lachnoclostridium sp.]|uniref:YitT family protein n=1 Tax=Lachnoclostridium sp. TaxID=2028282 RepID=UPI0028A0372F|nr:YitT family protein [Lachnoclostridium sp.]
MEWLGKRTNKRDICFLILGSFLISIAINWVFEPMGMVTGGVTGLAIVIKELTFRAFGTGLPIWLTNTILNVPLFIAGYFILGKRFIGKTLLGAAALTVFIYLIPTQNLFENDFLLAAIFGGAICGTGMGFVLSTMTTTGGTDLLAMLIHAKIKHITVPMILMIVDASVIIFGIFVFGIHTALYAIIAIYIAAKVSDGILEGLKFAKIAYIISDKYEEIAHDILHVLDHGVTGLSATGMYSNKDKKMLFCVVAKKEMVGVLDLVSKKDPKAFVIVSDVREVMGEGFIEFRQ